jgi:hypothetical protein
MLQGTADIIDKSHNFRKQAQAHNDEIIEGTSQIHQQVVAKYGLKKYGIRLL